MTVIHLFILLPQSAARSSSKGRDAACSERRLLNLGAPPAFCSPGGPQLRASRRPSAACRRTFPARRVMGTRDAARAGPEQTFCKCNLGIPGEAGTQGSGRGRGAKRKRRRPGAEGRMPAEPEREPIGQPRLLPITRLPPIPPLLFPKSRSHCAAQMWCLLCQSLEDRVGTGISRVRRLGQRS